MSEEIDIGHGVTISYGVNAAGDTCGIIERHKTPIGDPCSGWVGFRGVPGWQSGGPLPQPGWEVQSREPLTLSPSVLCRTCGHHGFIRDGRWVPA